MGVEAEQFFLCHGSFVDGFTKYDDPFSRNVAVKAPDLKLPAVP